WLSGDFNGDGKEDLIHLAGADYVRSWFSNGDGTFTVGFFRPWANYGIQAGSWVSGDLIGSGKGDLVHLALADYVCSWFSIGDVTFSVGFFRHSFTSRRSSDLWLSGDFNGDGKDDLIHLAAADYVRSWFSNGDGTFNVGFFRPWADYGIQARS